MKYNLFILLLITPVLTYCQNLLRNNSYQAGLSTYLTSGNQLPFWLHSNQYGEVPFEGNVLQVMASAHHEYDSTYSVDQKLNKMALGYGLRANGNVGRVNVLRLTEAYLKGRAGPFEFYAGRRREIVGLVDSTLSSGSYIWSGNALPLPKVQLSIPNYTPILKNKLLNIKGTYAHGWFGSADSVQNYYLHQKTFYARLGKPQWRMKFYAGFNHQVQWGGKPTVPFYDTPTDQTITSFPSDLSTYINVVTGISLNKNLDAGEIKDGIPYNEAFNRAGNHLGTIDIAMDFNTHFGTFMLYRQSIYEDGSLFYLNNISDGLLGLGFKNSRLGIGLEYLDTRNQGGNTGSGNVIPQLRGFDNYFNNGLYEDGYTYLSRTLGTPFLMPFRQFSSNVEGSNINPNYLYFNRIKVIYSSLSYWLPNLQAHISYSFIESPGRYGSKQTLKNHSTFLSVLYQKDSMNYQLSVASDIGDFWNSRTGAHLSVIKKLSF
ncbi:capsule assembly Wzi family protein [Jiulongibacter sediminis]|uniref:capsule assembly Wzi family protein n=1 Tax=Jiulongibacter sediminis TaxID=1605367 RepID=UPI0006DCD6B2|nr:capsule assembly Wzi family protein [Jiulongibacter sediminis]